MSYRKNISLLSAVIICMSLVFFSCDDNDDDTNTDPNPNSNNDPNILVDTRDGKQYSVVKIGNQTWMAENLNFYTSTNSWFYNDDSIQYSSKYGRLYDWHNASVKCPSGWHLPSDNEWKILEMEFGMSPNVVDNSGFRAASNGALLRTGDFKAKNGGTRYIGSGDYVGEGFDAYFWTSTLEGSYVYYRHLESSDTLINRTLISKDAGISVRCIKD